jgi:hypothetical protein
MLKQDQDMLDRCAGVRRALPGIRADIEEAKAIAHGKCDVLAAVLTELADAAETAIDYWHPENVDRTLKVFQAAKEAFDRAGMARTEGSLDREEALRLAADLEHLGQVSNIRFREYELARSQSREWCGARLDRLTPVLAARKTAEILVTEHKASIMNGRDSVPSLTATCKPEAALWEPLFQARALRNVPDEKQKDVVREFEMRANYSLRQLELANGHAIAARIVKHAHASAKHRRAAPAEAAQAGPK